MTLIYKKISGIPAIGIFGHVGNQNLGDEAIIAAVIQNIRLRYPGAQICGFTINPADTAERHKIRAFPIRRQKVRALHQDNEDVNESGSISSTVAHRITGALKSVPVVAGFLRGLLRTCHAVLGVPAELKFLLRAYHNLTGVDLLIIAGSQQLIDYVGGPWAFPYTIFKWVLLAKLAKTNVAFVSVGAGPIHSPLGKFFARASLRLSSYCSFRDESSRSFIETLGVSGENAVFPDLAYSLEVDSPSTLTVAPDSRPVIGINPVPFSDENYWLGANAHQYEIYIGKLADFALRAIQRGYRILFFPTQLYLDPPVISDIEKQMIAKADKSLTQHLMPNRILSFADLVAAICMTDIVLAARFHGIVIPYILNRPVLGIAYQRKTVDLMAQMGQSEFVVDINSFDVASLETRLLLIESRSATIKEQINHKKSLFRKLLLQQYDQVFNLVPCHSYPARAA